MLGLLGLVKRPAQEKPSYCEGATASNYSSTIEGYDPMEDVYYSQNLSMNNSKRIHIVSHGNPKPDTTTQWMSKEECLDMLGISGHETDDSGCHCNCTDGESHDSSFHTDRSHGTSSNDDTDTEDSAKQATVTVSSNVNTEVYNCQECDDDNNNDQEKVKAEDICSDDKNCQDCCETNKEVTCETPIESEVEDTDQCDSDDEQEQSGEDSAEYDSEEEVKSDPEGNSENEEEDKIEEDEEGGWIESSDEQSVNSDNDDEPGAYDLFQDTRDIVYEEIEEEEDNGSQGNCAGPALPSRNKARHSEVFTYPPKKGRSSRKTGFGNTNNKMDKCDTMFNLFEDDDPADPYTQIAYCTKAPTMNKNKYAFPRALPDDISDVIDFWETDFQVDKHIIPAMRKWEALEIAPKRSDCLRDYKQYCTYKLLNMKWQHCNGSKEQWYRKYGWASLKNILYIKLRSHKIYPEECEPIEGLEERVTMFEVYYDCLAMKCRKKKSKKSKKLPSRLDPMQQVIQSPTNVG